MTTYADVEQTGKSDLPFTDENPPEGSYLIIAVAPNPREVKLDKGDFKSYRMTVRGHDGQEVVNAEWFRKADSPAPQVGQTIEGDIDMTAKHGPKFTAAKKGSAGFSRDYQPKDDHPKKSAAMGRAHAQEMALRYAVAKAGGKLSEDFKIEHLDPLISWFFEDVRKARAAA